MAKIMEAFSFELNDFAARMEAAGWAVDFRGEKYPPRIVMEQSTPPLYKQIGPDGEMEIQPNPTIQIIGRPDLQVVTSGKLQISKKDLTKMTNQAAALLELFLHGFMQERKEMEENKE